MTTLDQRVVPYRPDEQAAVDAMFTRAREAQQRGDPRWIPEPAARVRQEALEELGCWVAEARPGREIVGVVALHRAGYGLEMPTGVDVLEGWRDRGDVVEVRRLRVAPEYRRRGVATALSRAAIDWSCEQGAHLVVLNTTSAQLPALSLYRGLGFREVCRSFVGRYELVWMALNL